MRYQSKLVKISVTFSVPVNLGQQTFKCYLPVYKMF